MRKHRNISMKYRWLAFLLCVAICAGNSPMQVFADTNADSESVTENVDTSDDINDEDSTEAESGDEVSAGGEESDQKENTESEAGDGVSEDEGDVNDPAEGTDTLEKEEKPGEDGAEEQEQEQVSGNTLDTISENTLESISENSLDEERQALIKEAEAAFDALLAEKPLMALLYRTEQYDLRQKAEEDSAVAATLEIGQTLYIQGVTITENDVWYRVQYWLNGVEGTGYVQSCYLAYSDEDWLAWEEEYLFPILALGEDEYEITAYGMAAQSMVSLYATDTSDISAFPGSYQSALRSLKSVHPNWTFVPMKTGLDFNTAVSGEMAGDRSLIQATSSNKEKGWVGSACSSESGWNYATKSAVTHYMDPRNFLTESYIFQFEQLTFNSSYHTEAAVQSFLNSTFMSGKLGDSGDDRTYAQAFCAIGKNRKLSPIHLASRVYQEQGKGASGLISGKYPGYEGYYNFFNVNVYGSSTEEKIKRGLEHAKTKGWNTRYKSLDGGAETIGKNYILKYQDTLYLQKFNVDTNSPYGVYNHQYMQNIQAPASESNTTKKMYSEGGTLNSAFVFKIPVYENMPNDQYYPTLSLNKTSLTMNKGGSQQLTLSADGIELDGSEAKWKSSDISVATVKDGTVTAVDKGEAVITASYQEVEVSCKVTVKIPLQSISLDKTEIRLRRPDTVVANTTGLSAAEKAENTATAELQVSFDPADTTADRSITWTSSNAKVAAVKADPEDPTKAVVSAVGTGEVTITAKASKAGNQTAACKVSVSAPIYRLELKNLNALETDPADRTTLFAGQSINLSAEYWPKDTTSDTKVAWSSSDESVATVVNGKVTAAEDPKKNTAVITAKMAGCEKGYEASYTIVLEKCTVTFMKQDGKVLGTESLSYGGTLSEETIQAKEKLLGTAPTGSVFIGWYTGKDGTGSRFDEYTPVHEKNITLYPYYVKRGEGFYVLPIGDQIYTGSVIKPKLQVYDGTINTEGELLTAEDKECFELVEGRDYTVSYKNNKNVNVDGKPVPTITVKGKGNYTGTQQVTFNIIPKALTDKDITADDITVAYNGRVIKSLPTVYRNGKKLIRNTDYTVTYPLVEKGAYQTAGIHPIVITGKGGYTGKITVYENITKAVLLSKVSVAAIPKQTYTNEQMNQEGGIRPESLNVTYKKEPLVEGQDYTVTYSNNQSIGKATATLTAVEGSGYIGSKSVTYQIVGKPIAKTQVEGIVNKEYTGTENDVYQSGYSLTFGETTLAESTDGGRTGDYTVSYLKTDKAGTATIIFNGINEYSGQLKKSYRILPYEFNPEQVGIGRDITVSYYTQDEPEAKNPAGFDGHNINGIVTPYVKGGSKPTILLSFHGQALTPGKDYSISYRNNNALTTAEMEENKLPSFTITGKGSFKGKLTGTFTITEGRMKDKVTMTLKDVVYREKKGAYKTKAVLQDVSGKTLAAGKDYDKNLEYTYAAAEEGIKDIQVKLSSGEMVQRTVGDAVQEEDIPTAGTEIRVTARGIGAYQGDGDAECSAVYRIVAADFTKVKVKVSAKTYQDGRPVLLTKDDLILTVKGVEEPLVLGEDFIIEEETYVNHTKKGKAKVTLQGIGNYGGEKTITYTIGAKTLWW